MPATFEIGQTYKRRDLHQIYGGQQQGGIITPSHRPEILLVTGEAGHAYGYNDGWDSGTFRYYGEGQVGDMTFVRGNRAIRDHADNGRELHLFQKSPPAHLRYVGQMVSAGYELEHNMPDRNGNGRIAIVFRLTSLPDEVDSVEDVDGVDATGTPVPPAWYGKASLADLKSAALEAASEGLPPTQAKRNVYHRSAALRTYVLARADGACEGCRQPAPFKTPSGQAYLECHHTRHLSDGGPDDPNFVIALCPTCHRRVHHGEDGLQYNDTLMGVLTVLAKG